MKYNIILSDVPADPTEKRRMKRTILPYSVVEGQTWCLVCTHGLFLTFIVHINLILMYHEGIYWQTAISNWACASPRLGDAQAQLEIVVCSRVIIYFTWQCQTCFEGIVFTRCITEVLYFFFQINEWDGKVSFSLFFLLYFLHLLKHRG